MKRTEFGAWLDRLRGREDQVSIVLSFVIGALVGLIVVAFILLTGRLAARMYPPGSAPLAADSDSHVGALGSGYLLFRYFPDARGSGIPQTKFALFINDGYISLRTVVGKFICCCVSLASGIALGREGPSVHIGAGVASVLGRRFGLSATNVKALIPIGCSAALAAAFNTPIAAVLFSLEEILGDLHVPVMGSVVISSATSWMVLHVILGDEPAVSRSRLSACQSVRSRRLCCARAAGRTRIGLFRETASLHPKPLQALKIVAILAVLKIVATATCYGSGNAGGIFGPSLFIGATLGGALGSVAHTLAPGITAGPGAYALIGMGAAFAGIIRTPITSVIMIFEMTRDYSIIVPLMISNLISYFVSQRLQRQPIYDALAHKEGVHLPSGELRQQLSRIQVHSAIRPDDQRVSPDVDFQTAADLLREKNLNAWLVARDGRLWGLLTAQLLSEDGVDSKAANRRSVRRRHATDSRAPGPSAEHRARAHGLDRRGGAAGRQPRRYPEANGHHHAAGSFEAYGLATLPSIH